MVKKKKLGIFYCIYKSDFGVYFVSIELASLISKMIFIELGREWGALHENTVKFGWHIDFTEKNQEKS